jgi:hypothetical protein
MSEGHEQRSKSNEEYDFDMEKSIWDWLHDPEIKGYVDAIRDEFMERPSRSEGKEAMIEYVYNEVIKEFPQLRSVPPKYIRNVLRLSFV